MNLFYTINKIKSSTLGQPLSAVLPIGNEGLRCWFVRCIQYTLKAFEKLSKIEYFINNIRLNLTAESFSRIIHNIFTETMNFIKSSYKDSIDRSKVYSTMEYNTNSPCLRT